MAKYKAIKDLPFAKAGEEVNVRDDGTVTSPDDDNKDYGHISAYEGWIEEVPECKRWRADSGEAYYYIVNSKYTSSEYERGTYLDNYRYKTRNYFETREEAEAKIEYDEAWQILVDSAKGFKPNWKLSDDKWYIQNHSHWDTYKVYRTKILKTAGAIYFATKKDAENSIENHRKEWDIVMGVGRE